MGESGDKDLPGGKWMRGKMLFSKGNIIDIIRRMNRVLDNDIFRELRLTKIIKDDLIFFLFIKRKWRI